MTERKIALSIEEAADYTGIGRNTLRKLVEWKKLPVLKVGRKVLIKTDILEKFMEANEGRDLRDKGNVKTVTRNVATKKGGFLRNRQRFYQTEAMIYLHARGLYHVLLLICNRELMFILSEKHRQDNAPQGCTTILIGIMSTELTRIVCQILAEQDLIIRERMKTIWRNQQRLMKKEYVH